LLYGLKGDPEATECAFLETDFARQPTVALAIRRPTALKSAIYRT
jgi:hypothetical protein